MHSLPIISFLLLLRLFTKMMPSSFLVLLSLAAPPLSSFSSLLLLDCFLTGKHVCGCAVFFRGQVGLGEHGHAIFFFFFALSIFNRSCALFNTGFHAILFFTSCRSTIDARLQEARGVHPLGPSAVEGNKNAGQQGASKTATSFFSFLLSLFR